jgi:hypothetical protein
MFGSGALRRIFRPKRDEVTGGWRKLQKEELHSFYFLTKCNVIVSRRVKVPLFWVVAPCSLIEVYRRFRGTFCLH